MLLQGSATRIYVVPRKGDVDRNIAKSVLPLPGRPVVPRKGDVDRNAMNLAGRLSSRVVPRKGDVDRNARPLDHFSDVTGRPPQGGRG